MVYHPQHHRALKSILSLLCLLAAALAKAAPPREPWQSPGFVLQSFIEIALYNEFSDRQQVIHKWTGPIHYFFVNRVGDGELHERLTRMHLEQLAEISGLTIQAAASQKAANLQIIFSSETELPEELWRDFGIHSRRQRDNLFRNSVCLGHYALAGDQSIARGAVIIPVDRARAHAKLVDCIVEETTQVLGLPNDSDKVFPSIFNDKSIDSLLSGLDYLLLKMLYDPRVKAGMSLRQAAPVLKTIVNEFDRNGLIDNATSKVRTGKLYELM